MQFRALVLAVLAAPALAQSTTASPAATTAAATTAATTTAATTTTSDEPSCFTGDSLVQLKGSGNAQLASVREGDEILAGHLAFEPIVAVLHSFDSGSMRASQKFSVS